LRLDIDIIQTIAPKCLHLPEQHNGDGHFGVIQEDCLEVALLTDLAPFAPDRGDEIETLPFPDMAF
jgi:hypothetical protein